MNNLSRREFLALSAGITGAVLLESCGCKNLNNRVELNHIKINSDKISKPLKIALFSDLHLARNLSNDLIEETIQKVNSLNADIIFFTGDAISKGDKYVGKIKDIFSRLSASHGCFAVPGNHDYVDEEKSEGVKAQLRKAGFEVLVNDRTYVDVNNEKICIAGLDDLWLGKQNIKRTLKGRRRDLLTILMAHNPSNIEYLAKQKPDLVLSGHTHGGQIFIPLVLNHLYSKISDPRFMSGLYKIEDIHLYVNKGIGCVVPQFHLAGQKIVIPGFRLFAPPEVTLITIN